LAGWLLGTQPLQGTDADSSAAQGGGVHRQPKSRIGSQPSEIAQNLPWMDEAKVKGGFHHRPILSQQHLRQGPVFVAETEAVQTWTSAQGMLQKRFAYASVSTIDKAFGERQAKIAYLVVITAAGPALTGQEIGPTNLAAIDRQKVLPV